jgi:hypothetical protein
MTSTTMSRFRVLQIVAGLCLLAAPQVMAAEISAVPGPDDQGGMLMPMVSITGADSVSNPTSGTVSVMFSPGSVPELRSLEDWSPGDWFATTATWRGDLGSPTGVGGTPAANAGNGDLFNNQYGFTFSNAGGTRPSTAALTTAGKAMAIRLTSLSTPSLESFNYVNNQNRWDQVFAAVNDQVLWNGNMWHNYFTLPASAPAGTYTAEFEVFVANTPFTGTTGWAQYDSAAAGATADSNFTPAALTYTWNVSAVPEPAAFGLLAVGSLAGGAILRRRRVR